MVFWVQKASCPYGEGLLNELLITTLAAGFHCRWLTSPGFGPSLAGSKRSLTSLLASRRMGALVGQEADMMGRSYGYTLRRAEFAAQSAVQKASTVTILSAQLSRV